MSKGITFQQLKQPLSLFLALVAAGLSGKLFQVPDLPIDSSNEKRTVK
jgi:hypothetical protein